jgi:hypothetical protein
MRYCPSAVITAVLLLSFSASAQVSTTTTKSKSQTQTDTRTWQSPDGTQRRTHTDTTTTTRSKSVTIGTPAAPPITALPGHPPPGSIAAMSPVGTWNVVIGQGRSCLLSLFKGFNAEGGGAVTQGCPSTDLASVGNWATQGGGATLVLTKSLVVPVATLRRTGLHRFDGTASSGEPITVWR